MQWRDLDYFWWPLQPLLSIEMQIMAKHNQIDRKIYFTHITCEFLFIFFSRYVMFVCKRIVMTCVRGAYVSHVWPVLLRTAGSGKCYPERTDRHIICISNAIKRPSIAHCELLTFLLCSVFLCRALDLFRIAANFVWKRGKKTYAQHRM